MQIPKPGPDLRNQNLGAEDVGSRISVLTSPLGASLVVQWLRLHAPNAGGPGLIPSRGTRSRMPQLRVGAAT